MSYNVLVVMGLIAVFSPIAFGATPVVGDRIDLRNVKSVDCFSSPAHEGSRSTLRAFRRDGDETGIFTTIFFFSVRADQKPKLQETPIVGQEIGYQTLTFQLPANSNANIELQATVSIENRVLSIGEYSNALPTNFNINESFYGTNCSVRMK